MTAVSPTGGRSLTWGIVLLVANAAAIALCARPMTCGSDTSRKSGSPPATTPTPARPGGYWHHQRRTEPHPAAPDPQFQDRLLDDLAGSPPRASAERWACWRGS